MMTSANMPKMAYSSKKKRKTRKDDVEKWESDYQKRLKKRKKKKDEWEKASSPAQILGSN